MSLQRSLASRIPDELQRTVEIGVLSFRPEGDLFKSIAVYTDELAFVVNPDILWQGERRSRLKIWARRVSLPTMFPHPCAGK